MAARAETFCEQSGKVRYATQNQASKAKRAFRKKFKRPNADYGELTVFQCNACNGWHLGRRFFNRKRRWSV